MASLLKKGPIFTPLLYAIGDREEDSPYQKFNHTVQDHKILPGSFMLKSIIRKEEKVPWKLTNHLSLKN